jgi:DNA-binding response OmpR family regulator
MRQLLESERRARQEAERALRVKNETLAKLSHEVRTPLQTILGWAWILRNGTLSPEETRRAVEVIERNAVLEARLIEEYLQNSRAGASVGSEAPPPELRRKRRQESLVSLRGAKVLVVDDDPDACELTRRVLAGSGAEVVTAASAADALRLFDGGGFDIVISDIGMPEIDGHEMMRRIRERAPEGGEVPAVALTAMARDEDRALSHLAGYQVHLAKPADPEVLVAVTGSLLGRAGRKAGGPAPGQQSAASGARILLLDDEGDFLDLLRRNFVRSGYETRTATTVAEAMQVAVEFRPTFLIVDWLLGRGENGASAARAIRNVCPEIHVIIASGLGPEQVKSRLGDLSVLAVVEKPYQMETLYAQIRQAMPGSESPPA